MACVLGFDLPVSPGKTWGLDAEEMDLFLLFSVVCLR